ncbi:hypothetical protein EVAR_51504_1 [Eumeta japonica]|uniref:Uncharacterized protein n=1 Tax=Eumeta variegata TaxID=151549 RepID=A0A4C1XAS5_EUMVA|nr:hypothetical protein EVAR_51504_1 [Eumeta japonica]
MTQIVHPHRPRRRLHGLELRSDGGIKAYRFVVRLLTRVIIGKGSLNLRKVGSFSFWHNLMTARSSRIRGSSVRDAPARLRRRRRRPARSPRRDTGDVQQLVYLKGRSPTMTCSRLAHAAAGAGGGLPPGSSRRAARLRRAPAGRLLQSTYHDYCC